MFSMIENISYVNSNVNNSKRIKRGISILGLLFWFHLSQKCKKLSIISITDDFISELAKQKIISMIGNMFYDILDINILKTIFCRPPFTPYTILYFYTFCRSYWGANSIPPQSEVLGTPRPDYTILYDYTFHAKVIEGGVD